VAGVKNGEFKELLSPFLREKIAETEEKFGPDSKELRAITKQYFYDQQEKIIDPRHNRRHYEAEMPLTFEDKPVIGLERLYRRSVAIEPTLVCVAHCRWCLRGLYPFATMKKEDITHATRYIGSKAVRDDLDEILITGGDPMASLPLLAFTFSELKRNAPNIRIVRVGTRVPFQDPKRINADLIDVFKRYPEFRFEVGVNTCHPIEFWPEVTDALHRIQDGGIRIYNQHPVLRGVNDDLDTLFELYTLLREHDVEAHYMFHAIPMRGTAHHRTSLKKAAYLATAISSSGEFSGRSKPHFAVLSDIGKIVMYEGVVIDKRETDNTLLLQSGFKLEDRLAWNPSWPVPDNMEVDENGYMRTWYMDSVDVDEESEEDNAMLEEETIAS
jgi:lysine 2,3-aminomutase